MACRTSVATADACERMSAVPHDFTHVNQSEVNQRDPNRYHLTYADQHNYSKGE